MSEKTVSELQVGDACFMFGGHRPKPEGTEMEVVKVGRQYVHCVTKGSRPETHNVYQFSRDQGQEKVNIGAPRELVVSREAHMAKVAADAAYRKLRNAMAYRLPDGVALADIQAAAALLRVDLSPA